MAHANNDLRSTTSDGWKLVGDHQMQDLREDVRALEKRVLLELNGDSHPQPSTKPRRAKR